MTYNHQPQQPSGINEKNEKNDVTTVPPEFPPIALLFIIKLQPNFFEYSERNDCIPIPVPIPTIMGEFSWIAADIALIGSKDGVVMTTIKRYPAIVTEPNNIPFMTGFKLSDKPRCWDGTQPIRTRIPD